MHDFSVVVCSSCTAIQHLDDTEFQVPMVYRVCTPSPDVVAIDVFRQLVHMAEDYKVSYNYQLCSSA